MRSTRTIFTILALCALALAAFDPHSGRAADIPRQLMTVGVPIPVPRAVGRFEQLIVDEKYRRLLAVHASSNELLVVNLDSGEVERRVVVGPGRGVAIDAYDGKIFVSTDDNYISQLNRRWLVENQRIYVSGPAGTVAFDSKRNRLYASEAGGSQLWVVQGKTDKLTQFPVTVPKAPSSIVYEPMTDRLYQNITSTNSVIVIDPSTNTVVSTWPLAQATDPRGIAVDFKGRRLFSAGSNGKLDVLDLASGKVTSTIDIPPRNDQIAYDEGSNTLYCASGVGLLTVIGQTGDGFNRIGDVTIPRGAHSLAVDPKTHSVWIAYGGDQNDYVLKLSPPASASPSPGPSANPSPAASGTAQVSGVVTYLQRSALPPSAIVHVEVDDVTLEDAPMVALGSIDIPVTHQVPIPFSVPYDATKIDPKHKYALNVRISSNGALLFLNKTRFPLFEPNTPTTGLTIQVDPVGP